MPAIHTSSFDASAAVRVPMPRDTDLTRVGFIEQTKAISVGIEAIVQRGIDEGQQMVVEGVHLVPGFLDRARWGEAIVLEFVLAVGDRTRHRGNFTVRDWETGGLRPLQRYVEHFAEIRRIQKYIVGRAEAQGVPVVDAPSLDESLSEVLGTILHRVEEWQTRRLNRLRSRSTQSGILKSLPFRSLIRATSRDVRPGEICSRNLLHGVTYSAPESARTPPFITASTSTRSTSPARTGCEPRGAMSEVSGAHGH